MKKFFTLLFILSAGLKLSASVLHGDTLKLSAVNHQDSLKSSAPAGHQDSLKSSALAYRIDSLQFLASVNRTDSLKLPLYLNYPKNTALPVSANKPGSMKSSALEIHQDSLKSLALVYLLDSLQFISSVNHTDSLKLPLYLNYPQNLHYRQSANLLVLAYKPDSFRLPSPVNHADSLKSRIPLQSLLNFRQQIRSYGLDSLKLLARTAPNDPFKGLIYSEIANRYLIYDTISNKRKRLNFQNEALSYTMMALHQYSAYNDTIGLRASFDTLAKVYIAQKKYSQAKWFILQSNTISRDKKDVANVISSLLTLSAIKTEIKDYALAMRDLNEALELSMTNHYPKIESAVLKNYALLYSRLKNYPKEASVLKKRDSLEETIRKDDDARLAAKVTAKDSLQTKKLDSLQNKKKVYSSSIKKLSKSSSTRKIASL